MLDALAPLLTEIGLDRLQVVTQPAPVVAIDAVHGLWQRRACLLWHPPAGVQAVASGTALCLQASGPRRMHRLLETSHRIWHALEHNDRAEAPAPRLWGGFSFAPGAAATAPWHDFGDATFVLPRLTYWRDGARAWLQAIGRPRDDTLASDLALAAASISGLPANDPNIEAAGTPQCDIAPADALAWQRQVEGIMTAIANGQVRKVVAARCAKATFARAPSVHRVIENLRHETGHIWRFAFMRNGATFLGATPELLVRRNGGTVESQALAGTLARAAGVAEDLLASAKDRNEHEFVRQGIVEALAPLCSALGVPSAPTVRTLRRLFHLATPIRGTLAQSTHVLELCERLHPTPATGGTPRALAVDMILATEATPRGWYAAPVGWFDASGDGELVVALRSGLLAENAAYIYAGAGIVAGSRVDNELAETELKQRVLLTALGLIPT